VTGVIQAGSLYENGCQLGMKDVTTLRGGATYEDFLDTVGCLVGTITSFFEGPAWEGFFEAPGRVGVDPKVGNADAEAEPAGELAVGAVLRHDAARSGRTPPGVMV